MQRFEIIT